MICFCSEVSQVIDGKCDTCNRCYFDPLKPTALLPGRFQPWHLGHRRLFEVALSQVGQVAIMVKSPPRDDRNPFSYAEVEELIHADLKNYSGKYIIMRAPNIVNISYGRDFGIGLNHIDLDEETKAMSATIVRAALKKKIDHTTPSVLDRLNPDRIRRNAMREYKKTGFKTGEYLNAANSSKYVL
jgi:cytidyltransferase-like protein